MTATITVKASQNHSEGSLLFAALCMDNRASRAGMAQLVHPVLSTTIPTTNRGTSRKSVIADPQYNRRKTRRMQYPW